MQVETVRLKFSYMFEKANHRRNGKKKKSTADFEISFHLRGAKQRRAHGKKKKTAAAGVED